MQVHKEKYLMIARDSEWLLSNGRRMNGCREVARKYKELSWKRGLQQRRAYAIRNGLKVNLSTIMEKVF